MYTHALLPLDMSWVRSKTSVCMAQLLEVQEWGSLAPADSEGQEMMYQPHAIRWVATIIYSASFTPLRRCMMSLQMW